MSVRDVRAGVLRRPFPGSAGPVGAPVALQVKSSLLVAAADVERRVRQEGRLDSYVGRSGALMRGLGRLAQWCRHPREPRARCLQAPRAPAEKPRASPATLTPTQSRAEAPSHGPRWQSTLPGFGAESAEQQGHKRTSGRPAGPPPRARRPVPGILPGRG